MRAGNNNNSFLSRVRNFLPCRREKRKKARISTKKQEKRKRCEIEKLLDNAKHNHKTCEMKKKEASSEIGKLEKVTIYGVPGLRELKICQLKCSLVNLERTSDSLAKSIKRLETAKEELKKDPHKFLKKNSRFRRLRK